MNMKKYHILHKKGFPFLTLCYDTRTLSALFACVPLLTFRGPMTKASQMPIHPIYGSPGHENSGQLIEKKLSTDIHSSDNKKYVQFLVLYLIVP